MNGHLQPTLVDLCASIAELDEEVGLKLAQVHTSCWLDRNVWKRILHFLLWNKVLTVL